MSSSSGEKDVFAEALEFSKTIDIFHTHRFLPNKHEMFIRLKDQAEHTLRILDNIPLVHRISRDDQAMHLYLQGKIMDVMSNTEHSQEAEDHLTEALKLNGKMVDAWRCLGDCVWKRGDFDKTKSCYECGLEQDPKNKELKRQLSIVERRLCQEVENRDEIIDDCIKHAKEAIALDIHDGISWYVLGNAYLTAYFLSGGWDANILMQSEKAFKNAVRDEKMTYSAELCYNYSMVFKFLEKYLLALKGFDETGSPNPALDGLKQESRLRELLDNIDSSLKDFNEAKRLPSPTSSLPSVESLVSALASVDLHPSYERVTVNRLTDGRNQGKAVIGKVLCSVQNPGKIPLYYVVCDSEQTCFMITVYGIRNTAIKSEDQITLLDPFYHFFDFEWKQKKYQFKSVRVDSLKLFRVNGALVSPEYVKHRSMYAELAKP